MNTNEQDFETQWKLREEELMKLPKEAVIGIHKLQSQLMFNSYYPMQARIQEMKDALSKALPIIRNVDTLSKTELEAKVKLIVDIESLLQSSKQL
jgi:hypothetical protein